MFLYFFLNFGQKENEAFGKRIVQYWEKVAGGDKEMTVNHFLYEGKSKVPNYLIILLRKKVKQHN